jgi:hypothetical protein
MGETSSMPFGEWTAFYVIKRVHRPKPDIPPPIEHPGDPGRRER